MSTTKHWSWAYFITDNQFFRKNNSFKNAWCTACLNHHKDQLRQLDIVNAAVSGISSGRTDTDWEAQARINCAPISGKPGQTMVPHLSKCVFVGPDIRNRAAEEINGKKNRRENPRMFGRSASMPLPAVMTGSGYVSNPSGLSVSATPSGSPSPSPLLLSASLLNLERPLKRPRVSSFTSVDGSQNLAALAGRVWNPPLQQEFGEDFCAIICRKVDSGRDHPRSSNFIGADTRSRGRKDGWKNKVKQAIVATMVSVDFEPYLMRTHDVSTQPKTGEALLQLVVEDIKWSEETYGLTVIAACSDDGGDARKMRRLLLALMPWLIIVLCWAHQINLIVGDYLSLKLPFQDCVPKALIVIKWMNNHSRALGLFRQEQLCTYQKFFALILPVLTRWTAHYLSLRRLLSVEKTLRAAWLKHSDTMIASAGSKGKDKAKAIAVQGIIDDSCFWYHIKNHLEPLAIAANVTQASNTRLYHVLTTLANLYRIYSNLSLSEDLDVRDRVLASLEKRWAAADQDPFIAAVVLNPFLRGDFLARRHIALTPIGLCNMLKRLYSRMFRVDVDAAFQAAFMDYFNKREEFSSESMALVDWTDIAQKNGQEVNPVEIWEGIDTREETGRNCLTKLAIHILSIVANSAGCERAFSHMGLVHTGIRSKLGVEKVRKTTMVGMDIKRTHLEAGLLHARSKRSFTSEAGAQESDHTSSAADHLDIGDLHQDDPLDFDQLSERLIAGAASANVDKDIGDGYDDTNEFPPAVTVQALTITIPPLTSATPSSQATQVKRTCIPLEILFDYPTDIDPPSVGMNSFWRGGIENLEKEMEVYDILHSGLEENSDGIQPEIQVPTMLVN
ncbi:hypothetical protein M378DRAFT_1059173 [Amanita muscaria Koide BX008]|uniref:HAT C-terminal dimerisation domain-containing protein n=1 Tax=Amanita muscaria (strain Koide BX008) TaxID=946122 RepID=A0A0C2WDZ7_AMAMK|nr:hypothetical protein M378DRAFT_1059173 [Amanita muscaria Koide BX008]